MINVFRVNITVFNNSFFPSCRNCMKKHVVVNFLSILFLSEEIIWKCSVEKVFLEILQYSEENTSAKVSFLIELQALGTGTGVYLWILQNLQEHLFYRIPPVVASILSFRLTHDMILPFSNNCDNNFKSLREILQNVLQCSHFNSFL